ncbi:Transcription factor bHLH51 [Heracleum sosnowskyi]|uniref:Transcription factor bHLH51 n=1 Tax=Heracleum sosnowskyi TaxID=360622 RepID=A0AAD8MN38_9APIA|nr:Transcription factor bHLH51 [Heracleum sosnowskyi]
MTWDSCNLESSNFWLNDLGCVEQFLGNLDRGSLLNGENLVHGGDKEETLKTMEVLDEKKDGDIEVKSVAALKSHSEAEKRRRERINAHLDTLRGLVPCTTKMDKASLLAEVICQVKQLKVSAAEASKGLLIATDADEVIVEPLDGSSRCGTYFLASVCCDYKREVLLDVKQALVSLHLNIVKAEISTFKKRMKYVFVFTGGEHNGSGKEQQILMKTVRQALSSILEKISLSTEYTPRTIPPNKRRKISFYESSSLSS